MSLDQEEPRTEPSRKVRAPRFTEKSGKKTAVQAQQTTAGILPLCPMNAAELAEQWQVSRDDAETITVKILRQILGEDDKEVIDSVPLVLFSMKEIAGNYGPGTYYLRGAAGKYAKNAARMSISEAYARSSGWGRLPVTAADAMAEKTIRQAAVAPTDPVELLAAVQQVVRRELEAQRTNGPAPSASADPMQAMEREMERMQRMMAMMETLRESARSSVRAELGITPKEEVEPASIWAELLKAAVPLVSSLMARQQEPQRLEPQPMRQAAPAQQVPPALAENPKTQEANQMPQLTQDEQKAISGAVSMLRPYGAMIVDMAAQIADDEAIIGELVPWIPGPMVGSLEALAVTVAKYGPVVLGAIHPALVTERWAGILPKLVEACRD